MAKVWDLATNQATQVAAHDAPIKNLFWVQEMSCVVTASWDRTIMLQDESQPDMGKLIRSTPSGHACDVTCAAYSPT